MNFLKKVNIILYFPFYILCNMERAFINENCSNALLKDLLVAHKERQSYNES